MTKKEMHERLSSMTWEHFVGVVNMIEAGYGGHGISLEHPATKKQINAVFQYTSDNGFVPDERQVHAIQDYARKYGDNWKARLLDDWRNGTDVNALPHGHLLRQVRNQGGPTWLAWAGDLVAGAA